MFSLFYRIFQGLLLGGFRLWQRTDIVCWPYETMRSMWKGSVSISRSQGSVSVILATGQYPPSYIEKGYSIISPPLDFVTMAVDVDIRLVGVIFSTVAPITRPRTHEFYRRNRGMDKRHVAVACNGSCRQSNRRLFPRGSPTTPRCPTDAQPLRLRLPSADPTAATPDEQAPEGVEFGEILALAVSPQLTPVNRPDLQLSDTCRGGFETSPYYVLVERINLDFHGLVNWSACLYDRCLVHGVKSCKPFCIYGLVPVI